MTYDLAGIVVHGNHLGRTLGYPTANLELDPETPLRHSFGVYAVTVLVDDVLYGGMANFGIRPTIDDHRITIEVYIFGFDRDIYGKRIYVKIIQKLRDEIRFSSLEALVRRMDQDREESLRILSFLLHPDSGAE